MFSCYNTLRLRPWFCCLVKYDSHTAHIFSLGCDATLTPVCAKHEGRAVSGYPDITGTMVEVF
jgi:hypothetical protein